METSSCCCVCFIATTLCFKCFNGICCAVDEGVVWVVAVESPLQPITSSHTLPYSPPSTHLVTLSTDYFILADAHSLQLWDSRYYTCQHHIKTSISSGSKVTMCGGLVTSLTLCVCVRRCGVWAAVCTCGAVREEV